MRQASKPGANPAAAAGLAAYEIIPGPARSGVVVLADHARNCLPGKLANLGLPESELCRHIAYDIGAEGVLRRLCEKLNAPGILAGFSRLLIDPNRGLCDPTLIMQLSDGAVVPGNCGLDERARTERIRDYYAPYHAGIAGLIRDSLAQGVKPVLLSIHSFTPFWKGKARPWHVGVLWDGDDRLARALIKAFSAEPGICCGDNEPYAGGLEDDTLNKHGTKAGLVHALIEYRQDLIADEQGQTHFADMTARLLKPLLQEISP